METVHRQSALRSYFLAALLAVCCGGCCILGRGLGPVPPPLPRSEILAALSQRAEQFQTVYDTGITLTVELETDKGMETQPRLGGILAFNRRLPGLWMRAEKMTVRVFELHALGERFSLELPDKREFVTGGREAYEKLPYLIHPYEAIAWFGAPGWLGLNGDSTMQLEENDYRFDVFLDGLLIRSVFVDRRTVAISRIVDYDLIGNVHTAVLMDRYRKVGNMEFPHQLTVDRPLYGCRVTLKLSSPKFNNPKVDNRKIFEPRKPPPGWDVIDLDYEPLSNVKTFSGEQ